MLNGAFAKLIDKRKKWARLSKDNKFDFDSILAGSYNDPSHFVYEILQNAEDAGAQVVSLELCKDSLDIYHDGRDFNFDDIDGVIGGIYSVINTNGEIAIDFHPEKCWQPMPGKDWVSAYRYHAKIKSTTDDRFKIQSDWPVDSLPTSE